MIAKARDLAEAKGVAQGGYRGGPQHGTGFRARPSSTSISTSWADEGCPGRRDDMKGVSIIGAGRLGASLGHALVRRGYDLRAVSCRTLRSARESVRVAGAGRAYTDIVKAAGDSGHGLPVRHGPGPSGGRGGPGGIAARLEGPDGLSHERPGPLPRPRAPRQGRGPYGVVPSRPRRSPGRKRIPDLFRGIFFGIEGDPAAVRTALGIARRLGGSAILLDEKNKALYHAACVVCSAGGTAVFDAASRLLAGTGLEKDLAARVLMPLAEKSLRNVKELGATAAFTGPISRGDVADGPDPFRGPSGQGTRPEAIHGVGTGGPGDGRKGEDLPESG